jgi:hypothetical protein
VLMFPQVKALEQATSVELTATSKAS